MRGVIKVVVLVTAVVLLPSLAAAQGTLTGTVRDQSGSVLPGVTVEASSPALIEKVRAAVTDTAGQYRIPGLSPGIYSLTFRLSGFTTVTRTGIELSGTSTLTIPVDLRVGTLAETITVTGETPVIDVQTAQRETVLSAEVIQTMPGLRTVGTLLNAVPGLVVNDGALALSPTMTFFAARGGPINEGRMAINGMTIAAPFNGGGVSTYILDSINTDEISVTVAGGLGESDIGGPMMNLVPRSGGNSFRGQAFVNNAGDWSRGDNLNAQLTAPPPGPNLKETPGIINAYDASASYGGPIMRDRLWFFGSYRTLETAAAVPGVVYNANAFNAARWDWIADPTVSARTLQGRESYIGRINMQVSAKHRVSYNQEYQRRCEGSSLRLDSEVGCNKRGDEWVGLGAGSTAPSPEANPSYFGNLPYHVNQAIWTAPMTNKLLLEAGFTRFMFRGGTTGRPAPDGILDMIPVTEQSTANRCAVAAGVPLPIGCTSNSDQLPWAPRANFVYRGVATANPNYANPNNWRASASYVTGSHEMKVGYQGSYIRVKNWFLVNDQQLAYRFNNGSPNQITFRLPEWHQSDRTGTAAIYVQDKWTRGRLTLQAALRYDRAWSFTPADHNGTPFTSRFNAEPISFERTTGVDSFNDITPRIGVAYDLFGNGRTALKFNIGHYLDAATNDSEYTSNSPAARIVRTGTRNWTDSDNDRVVDCDIMNFAANQECQPVTGDSLNFGKVSGNITQVNQDTLRGWNVRQSDWQWGVTVQQEIIPRMSVEVAYNRRWFLGAKVTDNTLRGPEDYQEFTITTPVDPRLPGGGGYPITLQLVTQAASDRGVRNLVTFETDFGSERKSYWDGVDVTLNGRLRQGFTFQIGTQTGRSVEDTCATARNIDGGGLIRDLRSCRDVDPFQTTVRGLASYTVPKIDVLISGTVRSQPELERSATWTIPNSMISAAIGRLPPGSTATQTTTVDILDSDHRLFAGERRTQIDMRFAKIFRFGGRRADIGVDLGNLLNTNYATTYENAYQFSAGNTLMGGPWNNPTAIYTPRFVRWNLTVDF